jgi:hypothetical protein
MGGSIDPPLEDDVEVQVWFDTVITTIEILLNQQFN